MHESPLQQSIRRWQDRQHRREAIEHGVIVAASGLVLCALLACIGWAAWRWLV